MILLLKLIFKGLYNYLTNKNYRTFIWIVVKYGDRKRYYKRNISFLQYNFIVPDSLSFIWQFKEIFVDESYRFNPQSNSPVIFDCGANIGTSCLYFKLLSPGSKITAFEADPEIAGILKSNLVKNNLSDIIVIDKAVWINDKGIEISVEGADGASIFSEGISKIKIDSVRLKYFLEKEDLVDMLKMDIEGAEVEVLKDCSGTLNRVGNLFIEYHSFEK
jgi:FkbM family methyltransferase